MALSPILFESPEKIPFVHVQTARLQHNAENELMVTLEIANETLEPPTNHATVEFGNFIYLSTSREALDRLIYAEDGVPDMSPLKNLIKSAQLSTSRIRNHQLILGRPDFELARPISSNDGLKEVYRHSYTEHTTLKDTVGGSVTSGLVVAAHTQDDEILNLDSREVQSLYVLVASYRTYRNKCAIGNVIRETLLENTVSPPTARLYRLEESIEGYGNRGDLWPGDIHIHDNTIMAGTVHSPEVHPELSPLEVDNLKIRDLRFLDYAQRLDFENRPMPTEERPYFSPLTLSRSTSGEIRGMFSFDLRSYVINEARFGGLIKNRDALLSAVVLDDMRVFRRVVSAGAKSNELTPGKDLNLSQTIPSTFEYFGSLKDGTVKLLRVPSVNNQEITNVVFEDKSAQDLDMGKAEYRVQVMVADQTTKTITAFRDLLQARLRAYVAAPERTPRKEDALNDLVDAYLAVVNFIFATMPFAQFSMKDWRKNLIALGTIDNPDTADHELMAQIVQTFAMQLSNTLKVGQATTSLSTKNYSKIAGARKVGALETEFTFRQRYALKNRKEVGFDYLAEYLTNTSLSIPSVSFEDMPNRIDTEVTKYSVPNPNAANINTYGYLSPLRVKTGMKKSAVSTRALQVDTRALTGLVRDRLSPTIELAVEEQKDAETNIQEALAMAGVDIDPLEESLRELLFPNAQKLSEGTDSDNYLSRTSRFIDDDAYIRSRISGSNDSILRNPRSRRRTIFAAPLAQQMFERQVVQFAPQVRMQNTDNILDSLAVTAELSAPTLSVQPAGLPPQGLQINDISKIINFDSLVKVEYLAGYDQSLGVLAPKWTPLSQVVFSTAAKNNVPLLCRLVPIQQTINAKNILDIESLGTLFMIGTPSQPAAPTNYDGVLKQIYDYIRETYANSSRPDNGADAVYARNVPTTNRPARRAPAAATTAAPTNAVFTFGSTGY